MPDIIITPSTGKLEFVNNSAQNIRKHVFSMDDDGLSLDAPLAATSIKAPLNIINVNVDNSNTNYPFVLASGSAVTGIKTLMMDGAGGTYNPFTNIATIDISGNSATTTLASNSSQLNGQAASYYTNIPARLGYTPVNQAGDTIAGNLTVNGNFTVNGSVTAFSASNIYLSSSVLTVEDNILTLNAFSPYLRYAGIEMYDSGSGTLSQLLWDGDGDYFFLTGSSVNGKIITGPDGQTNLTSGYIPKATAGYKLGNSLIYDNGTNVAIGTTSPAQKLDVIGNIRCVPVSSAWAEGLSFSMPTTSSWGGLRWRRERANADGNHYIGYVGTDTTDDLVFGSNNAGTQIDNNIRITKAGLVGIGTSSPVAKLHVVGVISGSSFSGAGTGLTGTAASLTVGTATIANGVATGAVKSGGLEENSVITSKIADGNVTNVKLASSSVTIGSSAVSLGSTLTTIAGLTSVTSTTFVGALTGNASTATNSTQLGGVAAASYVTLTGTQTLLNKTLSGSLITVSNGQTITEYAGYVATPSDYPTCTEKARIYTIGTINSNAVYNSYIEIEVYGSHRGYDTTSYFEYKRWILLVGDKVSSNLVSCAGTSHYVGLWNGTDATGFNNTTAAGTVLRLVVLPRCGAGQEFVVKVRYANVDFTQGTFTYTNLASNPSVPSIGNQTINISGNAATATNATQLGGVSAASYVTLNDTQSLTNKTITGTFTGNLTGTASTATTSTQLGGYDSTRFLGSRSSNITAFDFNTLTGNDILSTGAASWTGTSNFPTNAVTGNSYQYGTIVNFASLAYSAGIVQTYWPDNDTTGFYFRQKWATNAWTGRVWQQVLTNANYNSFAPTLTGTGASGNWTITSSWATNAVTALNVGNGTITIAAGTGVGVGSTNTFTTNQSGATTVTISNSGVTSNVAGTGISVSGATGAVTITNSGVTSAVAGTGVGVSAATGAVTFSIGQAVGPANTPSFAGIISSAVTNYAYLQVVDTNNFWITPGNNNWGLYFETSGGGLLGGTGDSNRLGFVGAGTARFYVDLNNGNGWFGGALTAAGNISAANLSGTNTGDQTVGNGTITIAAGTGVGVGSSNTFTTNQSGNSTVTITNTGVTSVAGTSNQVSVSAGTGTVTFSLPQNIHTAATPTFASVTTSTDGANITMAGTTNAEGIRMTPASSTTYPVFLRSVNPGGGEASPWIYKEQATDWGIWHNNPVNSIDFTKQGSGGIASNVGGSSSNTVTVRVEMATGYVQTIAGYRNSAGTTILDNTGNITGNAATATNANAISFTEVELNAPVTVSGTWTTGNGSEWGEPKFGSTFNQFRYTDGDGPYVEYNVPANHHACFISQLQWDTGGYADCHGVQSDGDLVFLRRINTRQLVENSNHGNTIQHDGSTVTFVGSGLGSFTKIRITNRGGRIHMTGIAFTRQSRDGYEGTGMVHPAQISHQGAGSGLNADLLDGYNSATANTANTIVLRDASGNFSAGTITATLSGNVSGTAGGETFGTVTGRGSSTTTQISVGTTAGGSMYTGIKSGAGYSDSVSGATFKSITDHPTGGSYAFAAYFNGAPGTGTNSFFVAADGTGYFKGNVGIGISNATAKLESYYSSNAITFNYLATNLNNNSPIPVYGFDVTNGAGENRSIKAGIGYERHLTNGRGTLHFYNDSTNDTQSLSGNRGLAGDIKMSIDNDGNVGIGSVTPSYKLHVMGNGYFSSTLQVNSNITLSGGGDVIINDSDGTGAFNSFMDSGIGYIRIDDGGSANGKLNINSGLVYIQGAGNNVGIGTTVPGQKLDVEGRIRTRGATGTGGFEIGAATTGVAKWRIEWDSASDSLDFNWVG